MGAIHFHDDDMADAGLDALAQAYRAFEGLGDAASMPCI